MIYALPDRGVGDRGMDAAVRNCTPRAVRAGIQPQMWAQASGAPLNDSKRVDSGDMVMLKQGILDAVPTSVMTEKASTCWRSGG